MTTRRAQGIDISYWQREFNPPDRIKDKIDFIVLRASKDDFKDGKFEDFYLKSLNFPIRGAYHYYATSRTESSSLNPGNEFEEKPHNFNPDKHKHIFHKGKWKYVKTKGIKKIDGTGANWQEQADLFLEQIKDKDFHFLALDIEGGKNPKKYIGQTKNIFTSTDVENMVQWIEYVRKATNIPVMVYTRPLFLRDILIPKGGDKLKDMDLWLAWYGEGIDPEKDNPYKLYSIPGVSQSHWHIWQYSADKNKLGSEFGVKTSGIDLDVFNGTLQDMKDWLAGKAIQTGIPEAEEISEVTVPVENQMEWIITQLEKLIAAGIKPAVEINIEGTLFDVEKLKSLKETLEKGGITPEVNLSIDMSSNGNTSPRTKTPIDTSQTNPKTPPDRQSPSPTNHESFQVRAKAMKTNKNFIPLYEILVNKKKDKKTDEAGKPIMVKTSPVIRIPNGETFSVSSTHKVGSKDKGDGKVIGTGDKPYYLITDYSANDKAIGKYVMKDDVKVKR